MKGLPQDCGDDLAGEMDHFAPTFYERVKTRTLAKTGKDAAPKNVPPVYLSDAARTGRSRRILDPTYS